MSNQDHQKRRAAQAALRYLVDGEIIGVGTGSTVNFFIEALGGHRERVPGTVSSSEASTAKLRALGIDVLDLNEVDEVAVYIDGADEATRDLHLIKGGGGALTREKIIAGAARRFVCIVDEVKLVDRLGRFPLPVEVIPMARRRVAGDLERFGAKAVWREGMITDNGNHILDLHGLAIDDPVDLERQINQIPGVVTVGLFAARPADILLVGTDAGVVSLVRDD
jgi:ribose 5-phosphate isomerase A